MSEVEYRLGEDFPRVKVYGHFMLVEWSYRRECFSGSEEFFGMVKRLPNVDKVFGGRVTQKQKGWSQRFMGVVRFATRSVKSVTPSMRLVMVTGSDGKPVPERDMYISVRVPMSKGGGQASKDIRGLWCQRVGDLCRDIVGDAEDIMQETVNVPRRTVRSNDGEMTGSGANEIMDDKSVYGSRSEDGRDLVGRDGILESDFECMEIGSLSGSGGSVATNGRRREDVSQDDSKLMLARLQLTLAETRAECWRMRVRLAENGIPYDR